jgi:hypothetical protein
MHHNNISVRKLTPRSRRSAAFFRNSETVPQPQDGWLCLRGYEVKMKWQQVLLAIVRCELSARYSHFAGWQVSAKGALPVLGLALLGAAWWHLLS